VQTTQRALIVWLIVTATALVAHGQMASAPDHLRQDVLTCSPAPCVLPPAQATSGASSVYDGAIAVDPVNPKNLILGTWDGNCNGYTMAAHVSTDGGSTWARTDCMGGIVTQRGRGVYYATGQPMVAYDLSGNAYIAGEYIDSMFVGFGLVAFEKSSDGVNWSEQQLALSRGAYEVLGSWMTSDTNPQSPYADSLYVSTVTMNEPSQRQNQGVVSHSNDGGLHWTLDATWLHCPTSGSDAACELGTAYMLFSKSSDGGDTWTYPTIMAKISNGNCRCYEGGLPNTNPPIYFPNYAAIGVDNSNDQYAGNLYVSMFNWTGTQQQVLVVNSKDGGNTWSQPVPVAPPSDTHDQFLPWLSVSSTGLLGVSWLDRRNDPDNVNYQAFAEISKDGGQTFQTNVALTPKLSNPNLNGNDYLGDYAGNTWVGSTFLAVWPDTSNGVNVQEVIGGVKLH